MGWVILIILLVALATGALWAVVKVAVGVAVGLFLAVVLLAAYAGWRLRRVLRSATGRPQVPGDARWRQMPGSTVEVLDPDHRDD